MLERSRVVLVVMVAFVMIGCSKTLAPVAPPPTGPPPAPAVNQPPDTWFAGADPNDPSPGWQVATGLRGGNYLDLGLAGWTAFTGVPNSLLSGDSLLALPANRAPRRTFFEIYNDRLWLRQEGDTVHLNSWLVFPGGGFDSDSPYAALVDTVLLPPSLRGAPVFTPGPPNGSPIGFRVRVQLKDSYGLIDQPSESLTYPRYQPASVLHNPVVNGYWGVNSAGRGYASLRAVDGDGAVDRRVDLQPGGAVGIADRVDAGGGSATDVALRSKILTFYVNHAPVLLWDRPAFFPTAGAVLPRDVGSAAGGRANTSFNLSADDDDWLDPTMFNPVGGTPFRYPQIIRYKIAILGKRTGTSSDTCFVDPQFLTSGSNIRFTIPDWIAAGPVTVRIRTCDCLQCDPGSYIPSCPFAGLEVSPSQGTCVDTDIPCVLVDASPLAVAGAGGHR